MAQTPNQKKPNHSKPPLPKQPNRSNIVTLVVFLAVGIFFAVMMTRTMTATNGVTQTDELVTSEFTQAVEQGRVIAAAWSGKVKTASTMVCLCAMLLNVFGAYAWFDPLCNAVIVLTTAYSGIEYFIKNADVFREPD